VTQAPIEDTRALAALSSWRPAQLNDYLRNNRGSGVHIIDPFKVPLHEALAKARLVEDCGGRWLILASTDYHDFDEAMREYVPALAASVSIPVLLHFPPTVGTGLPVVAGAAGYLWPALLRSNEPYFVWQSLLETVQHWSRVLPHDQWPEPVLCGAVTVGADSRTGDLLGTDPLDESVESLRQLAAEIRRLGLDMVYLYSRNERVSLRTCSVLREELEPWQIVFVSGNVRDPDTVRAYLDAGADYVGFAGAGEGTNWYETLPGLLAVTR
jgi:heptaprenylglyceryl phosphate synthase